ncbi:hypothetical protein BU25DRAFT_441700 [Macroventuria anomochaeta]|uniref:Uncharacterized protein n=1 Tax=Macroventuria anomochaeta TaxID=301207 RepID=A0ACB6RSQ1_9PLEO|nr:uncharacterized protein BU25DRAFT_441700 [Macroventuria anomochaeta]KAF2624941.1 hypothetical protein BU25DRAFT_441700 [Macroventuria anomochaeta]
MSEPLFDGKLSSASKPRKCDIVNTFWPDLRLVEHDLIEDDYADLLRIIDETLRSLAHHKASFADQFLGDFLTTVTQIREHQDTAKTTLIDIVVDSRYPGAPRDTVVRSIELAARLWLGVNICSRVTSIGPSNPKDSCIEWSNNRSLSEVVAEQFERKAIAAIDDDLSLNISFTAVKLMRKRGVQIRWTDSLVEHLKLEGPAGDRSLSIYGQKLRLINHHKDRETKMLKRQMLEEAIYTLDLLFPVSDLETIKFLKDQRLHFNGLAPYDEAPVLNNLNGFVYWRRNLEQLLRLLNGPPETTGQMLRDKRSLVTLWIGIFGVLIVTILFGILATVFAAIQYVVAVRSYNLALALACMQTPAPSGFC